MAKREANNFIHNNNKKVKVDDLWEDDLQLDSDVIEDCFQLATQVCENDQITCTQRNNITILPTYSAFKDPKIVSSTQIESRTTVVIENNTSKNHLYYENRIKELQEKLEQKTGEAAILRSNLNEAKASMRAEQERQQKEWKDKIHSTQKEASGIKSTLEFKNLEIANLKQKIKELSKLNAKLSSNSPQKPTVPRIADETHKIDCIRENNYKLATISVPYYPLKTVDLSVIFQSGESHTGQQNKKNSLNLDVIYGDISTLINLTIDEINQECYYESINKIIYVFTNILLEFRDELENSNSNESKSHGEMGVKASKVMLFLSELIRFNNYLSSYLFLNKNLQIDPNKNYISFLKSDQNLKKEFYHLDLLKSITTIIQSTKETNCTEFLSSLIAFISKGFLCNILDDTIIKFCDIIKEIFLMRPNYRIMSEIVNLFQIPSSSEKFTNYICKNLVQKSNKHIRFSQDNCIFYLFLSNLEQTISKISITNFEVSITSNYLNIVSNIFEINPKWLRCPPNNCCECLVLMYRLCINLIYKSTEYYKDKNFMKKKEWDYSTFFKFCVNIMHLLNFYAYELIESNITTFAQYKEILLALTYLKDELKFQDSFVMDLESINISDDLPEISADKFQGVNF